MRPPKKLMRRLGVSLASLVIVFAVVELICRWNEPGPFSFFDANPYQTHERVHHVHKPDFEGRWDGTWYATNSLGMRGPELAPDFSEDEFRVVCVGDSCTFGKGVTEANSWPRQLERILRERAAGAWRPLVANLGVNGFSGSSYARLFAERGKPLKPHLVAVGYNLNDFPNAIKAVDDKVYNERKMRTAVPTNLRNWMGRSALYRWVRATYYHMNRERDWKNAEAFASGAGGTGLDSEVWKAQRGHLETLKADTQAGGGELCVFLFPYESQVYLDSYDSTPIEQIREVCRQIDVPFVDLSAVFRARAREAGQGPLFLRGDRYHPTPEGYALVAAEVLRVATERGWLPGS